MARGHVKGIFKSMPRNADYPDVFGKTKCNCGKEVTIKIDGHGFLYVYCPKGTGCGTKITTCTVEGVKIVIKGAIGLIPESADNYREYIEAAMIDTPHKAASPAEPAYVIPADKPAKPRKKPKPDIVEQEEDFYDDFTE